MKRLLICLLTLAILFQITACADMPADAPEPEPTPIYFSGGSTPPTPPPTPTPSPTPESGEEPDIPEIPSPEANKMTIQIGDTVWTATLEDNPSVTALKELLGEGPLTVDMSDYGGFEKVGSLGTTLPQSNRQITTKPGDIILYQGNSITIYYDENSWNFTLLGHIDEVTEAELRQVLKAGGEAISVTFSLD